MKNDFIHLRNSSLKKLTYTLPKKIETVNTILKLPKLSFSKKIKTLPRPVFTSEEELFQMYIVRKEKYTMFIKQAKNDNI